MTVKQFFLVNVFLGLYFIWYNILFFTITRFIGIHFYLGLYLIGVSCDTGYEISLSFE